MKIISLDIETTGLDPQAHDVIEIGAVAYDTDTPDVPTKALPTFHAYIDRKVYAGTPYALAMHGKIFQALVDGKGMPPGRATMEFRNWLDQVSPNTHKLTVVGKNAAGFDIPFLQADALLAGMTDRFSYAVLDPGSWFFNPQVDQRVPSLSTCLKRAGFPDVVTHTAVEDAQQVVDLVRYYQIHMLG
jgi:oligoribonuclease